MRRRPSHGRRSHLFRNDVIRRLGLGDADAVRDFLRHAVGHDSLLQAPLQLSQLFHYLGHGRVRLESTDHDEWTHGLGGHSTGTTRMADDPKQGVADREARVHGVDNLYLTGGGLYPVAGWQHPTLTLVALALRLGEHLKAEAKRFPA